MPMNYVIDEAQHLVRITGSGPLTDDEMAACVQALRSDPALQPEMPTLSDMREIEVAFTAAGVQRMIGIMRSAPAGRARAKAAIVVSSDVAFGMGRMLELYSNDEVDRALRIFRNMKDAEDWLGLEPETQDRRQVSDARP